MTDVEINCIGMAEHDGDHVNAEAHGLDPQWFEIVVVRRLEGGELEELEATEPLRFGECHRRMEILMRKYGVSE